MTKSHRQSVWIAGFATFAVALLFFIGYIDKIFPPSLPPAIPYNETAPATPMPELAKSDLPLEINLKVPFTSQAPHQNWNLPYKEFCEEASVLMAASYIKDQPISSPEDADTKLLAIKDFEEKRFGFHEDTGADDTAVILREYYGLTKVQLVENPTLSDIKISLAAGKVIIVPLAGRQLGNPYYQQPGPLYHMLVIKGYTKNGDLITNDPGTRRGADYIYKASVILKALHDWNGSDIEAGRKVAIVVG